MRALAIFAAGAFFLSVLLTGGTLVVYDKCTRINGTDERKGGLGMFRINQRSAQPIYEQILENVETLIISGVLLKDEQLPSVRSVARDLAVNRTRSRKRTVFWRAGGIIYSRPGRGSFVAVDAGDLQCRRLPPGFCAAGRGCGRPAGAGGTFGRVLARVRARFQKGGDDV